MRTREQKVERAKWFVEDRKEALVRKKGISERIQRSLFRAQLRLNMLQG